MIDGSSLKSAILLAFGESRNVFTECSPSPAWERTERATLNVTSVKWGNSLHFIESKRKSWGSTLVIIMKLSTSNMLSW